MFASEPDPAVCAHARAQDLDVSIALSKADLEIAVGAVTSVGVVLPLRCGEGDWFAVRG